jgi:hypothetical protein
MPGQLQREGNTMQPLDHKQIFRDVLSQYFAPLVGAVRGSFREVARVNRRIALRKLREAQCRINGPDGPRVPPSL